MDEPWEEAWKEQEWDHIEASREPFRDGWKARDVEVDALRSQVGELKRVMRRVYNEAQTASGLRAAQIEAMREALEP